MPSPDPSIPPLPPQAPPDAFLDQHHQVILLRLARAAIAYGLTHGRPPAAAQLLEDDEARAGQLQQHRSAFVTLHLHDNLRGCIGSLDAARALAEEIAHNAFAAAFHDPRFAPLTRAEFPAIHLHLSVLTPPRPLPVVDEADLLGKLRVGIDGVILQDAASGRSATFIPAVWDHCPAPAAFIHQLKRKAGLPDTPGLWRSTYRVLVYQAQSFAEPDLAASG
jgi:AmmeMemoRadiSam system protein A